MRRGFTLVELAIVIAVLAIIAGSYAFYAKNYGNEAKVSKMEELLSLIRKASENYYDDVGGFPSDAQKFWKNLGVTGWDGPYITAPFGNSNYNYFPKVPFGSSLYLECSSGNYFRAKITDSPKNLCLELDKKTDDGNLNSGRVRYDNNNHYCYYYFAFSEATCK